MATLPTYAQIGLAATCLVTVCRVLQGISSIGEITGAEIYLTELIKLPERHVAVSLISVASKSGAVFALCVASLSLSMDFNWRFAFLIGAAIAVIGVVARTRLRETPDFVDMKLRMKRSKGETGLEGFNKAAEVFRDLNSNWKEKVDKRTMSAYFILSCAWPVCFYFIYVYCSGILEKKFSFSPLEVINQNLIVAIVGALSCAFFTYMSKKVHPLRILMFRLYCFAPVMLLCPYLLENVNSATDVLLIQLYSNIFWLGDAPGRSVLLIYFPVFGRFTYSGVLYALSRAAMYVLTSFGMIYLTQYFGHAGLLLLMLPAAIGYAWGIRHFMKLEAKFHPEMYPKYQFNNTQQSPVLVTAS
jgi:MHS family proline/betaine transporter-like MFS transporter